MSEKECFLAEATARQAQTLPVQKKMLQKNKIASSTEVVVLKNGKWVRLLSMGTKEQHEGVKTKIRKVKIEETKKERTKLTGSYSTSTMPARGRQKSICYLTESKDSQQIKLEACSILFSFRCHQRFTVSQVTGDKGVRSVGKQQVRAQWQELI